MNLILLPIWLLSGAFFPATGLPVWLAWVMQINPLTYGMAALRRCLYLTQSTAAGTLPPLVLALGITLFFGVATLLTAVHMANRSSIA
jgi:ABC-2 type transport system permease protein